MIKKVFFLVNYNLYESKRYFTQKLAEAFERKGIETKIYDSQEGNKTEEASPFTNKENADFTCTFNDVRLLPSGTYPWDLMKIPHVFFRLDPIIYSLPLTLSPYAAMTCVDQTDYSFLLSKGYEKTLFFPHAVERELALTDYGERPYEVVMIGSCYDPDNLKAYWQQKYSPIVCKVIEDALEICFSEPKTHFYFAVDISLKKNGLQASDIDYFDVIYYVDNYMRGVDRLELIYALKDIPVHVFGGTCWRKEKPIAGWNHYLGNLPNVHLHPAISFKESIEILKKAKVCLNSVPSFKNGTHERVLISLACGAVPITTESIYLKNQFIEGKEIFFYRMRQWKDIYFAIKDLLKDETNRQKIAEEGRAKVLANHTWDSRVDQLLKELPPILETVLKL